MNLRSCLVGALVSVLGASAFAACAAQETSGTSEADFTTQGGVLGQAPRLELGRSKTGAIQGGQIDVWAVDLRQGDRITVVETVTRGSLAPDFALFLGGHAHVRSEAHEALPKQLTKSYVATAGGKHFIGVAAFQGRGSGDYKIKITCTGGPCAGEPFVAPLEDDEKNACIQKARECALTRARPAGGGKATIAAARAAWTSCLQESSLPNGRSCAVACDDGDAQGTCKAITDKLKFYASKPPACTQALRDCMDECIDAGDRSPISEQICMIDGFNSTCDGFARANAACGGAEQPGSNEECHSLCQATFGAWNDDLDTICEERCPE